MKWNRKNATLFFTLIVVMMGFGIIIPILPFYVESLGANGQDLGILMAIFSVAQFIFSPIWGSLSDRYGRKPILMIGVIGNALTQVLFGLSHTIWMMFAARALSGILSSATLPTAMAYVADTTSKEERGGAMGIVGAAFGIGMVLGPGVGGFMATNSLSTPFFFAAVLSMAALVLIWIILPESLPKDTRMVAKAAGNVRGPQIQAMKSALLGPLGFLFFLAFLVSFGMTSFEGIFGLFAAMRFDYGPAQVGVILTVIGLVSAVIQGVATGPATKRWGEDAVIKASLIGSAAGFVIMLMARSYPAVLLTVGAFVLSNAMLRPAISAEISRGSNVSQGINMGLNNAFMSLGRIIGPLWAGFLIDVNVTFPYTSAAIVMLIGFGLSLWKLSGSNETKPMQTEVEAESPAD